EALDRLTEDLDVADDRVLGLPIGEEGVVAVLGVFDYGVDRVEGVEEVGALAVHRAMASDRICSRRYGLIPPSLTRSTFRPSRSSSSCHSPTKSSRLRPGSISTR